MTYQAQRSPSRGVTVSLVPLARASKLWREMRYVTGIGPMGPALLPSMRLWPRLRLESSTFRFEFASFEVNALPFQSAEPSDLHPEDCGSTCLCLPEQFHHGLSGCIVIGCPCHHRDQLVAAVQTGRNCRDDFKSFIHQCQELFAAGRWIFAALCAVAVFPRKLSPVIDSG